MFHVRAALSAAVSLGQEETSSISAVPPTAPDPHTFTAEYS